MAKGKCEGWYYHSQCTLTPTLAARNEVLYAMRATKLSPSFQTLDKLKWLQWEVDKVVAMAKTSWSCHLVEAIHNMSFQPKEAWANIKLLCKGYKSHHSSPQTIHMRMASGELAMTNGENVLVFAGHFGKVLNDMKPTDTSVINGIHLREAMQN